ncbi:ABC-2 type transport system permease protein [Sphingomonas sp. F9_3S_D5_B_2]
MKRLLRGAFVIGRRDFAATVLSKTFLFFLLGPMFPLLFGGVFGSIGAQVASQTEKPVVAVVSSDAEFAMLDDARSQLARAIQQDTLVALVHYRPEANAAAQVKRLLATRVPPIRAVLTGGLAAPHLTGPLQDDPTTGGQLRLILANARSPGNAQMITVTQTQASSGSLAKDQATTAQVAQVVLFLLTLMLSTMVLSQLIEEKSNKVIEVIAAAIPIEAMFVGKLFAMLAASILGLVVWIGCGALLIELVKHGGVSSLPPPAVGWPAFLALSTIYFGMNYLLFGAAFLMIGAQASTAREVQTMSMPVTFGQVLIFGFAATAIGSPNSAKGLIAAAFPLSSPMVMLARAAQRSELWPHLLAVCWQALWIALILRIGSHLFRKTVLKSGPRRRWFERWRSPARRHPRPTP